MQHCQHCHIYSKETREYCPLCGNKLSQPKSDEVLKSFPDIPSYLKSHLKLRLLILITIIIIVVSFTTRAIFPTKINWPFLLVLALGSLWLDMVFLVQKRFHLAKKILGQVMILSLLSLFWDFTTGYRGWAITYVFPALCILALLLMYSIALIMKLSPRDYITYAVLSALFGIIPLLFILIGLANPTYPSIISIAVSIIFLAAIFILQGESMQREFKRRMHF